MLESQMGGEIISYIIRLSSRYRSADRTNLKREEKRVNDGEGET